MAVALCCLGILCYVAMHCASPLCCIVPYLLCCAVACCVYALEPALNDYCIQYALETDEFVMPVCISVVGCVDTLIGSWERTIAKHIFEQLVPKSVGSWDRQPGRQVFRLLPFELGIRLQKLQYARIRSLTVSNLEYEVGPPKNHTGTTVYSQPSAFLQSAWPPRGPGKQHAAHPSRNLLRYPPGAAFGGAPRALRALGKGDI